MKTTERLQVADNRQMFRTTGPCDNLRRVFTRFHSHHLAHFVLIGLRSCCFLFFNAVEKSSMEKKVVLITGCSSGIGLSLAVRLASDPNKTFKGNRSGRDSVKMLMMY